MIELSHIRKSFRVTRRSGGLSEAAKSLFHRRVETVEALRDISFTLQDGEIVGYIGPNGAGKSSTIKIMSGILMPDGGSCLINGLTPWKQRAAHVKNIGVVFGQRSQLWWDVPAIDSFELIRDIYEVPQAEYRKNLQQLTELLDLGTLLKTPTRMLSLGQRMRCEIAASLLHSPKILFLDEPTIGLDAVSKIAVRNFIKTLNRERGTTVILTTHDMQDIEALAERLILIGKGQILLDGSMRDFKTRYADKKKLALTFLGPSPQLIRGLSYEEITPGRAVVTADTGRLSLPEAIRTLSERCELTDITVLEDKIDDVVVRLYKEFGI